MQSRKTVLITGAAGRAGRAIAVRMIADGWQAVLADCDESGVLPLAKSLGTQRAASVVLDVTD